MTVSKFHAAGLIKAGVAIVSLGALALLFVSQWLPQAPLPTLALYALGGTLVLLAAGGGLLLASLSLRQFILRRGGTDTAWFWFKGEPPGLERLRKG